MLYCIKTEIRRGGRLVIGTLEKRMKSKKKLPILIILLLFILGCQKEEIAIIPNEITIILKQNNIENTTIDKLGNYSKCAMKDVDEADVIVTKEEVERYCEIQIESYNQIVPIENREIVHKGDVVYISYMVNQNDKLINRVEHDNLIVGSGKYNEQIEEALVGRKVGESFYILIEMQEVGMCKFSITVESINCFITYELTDVFVKENFGVDTVAEYYQICEGIIREQKILEKKKQVEKELFSAIARTCKFEVDVKEIAQYSMKYLEEGEKLARVYDLSLEAYVEKILHKNVDKFYQECYQLAESEIQEYLIVGAIFSDLDLKITEKEYNSMCKESGYEVDDIKLNEHEDALIRYNIMRNEVLKLYQ